MYEKITMGSELWFLRLRTHYQRKVNDAEICSASHANSLFYVHGLWPARSGGLVQNVIVKLDLLRLMLMGDHSFNYLIFVDDDLLSTCNPFAPLP